jgi:hypothetical protein
MNSPFYDGREPQSTTARLSRIKSRKVDVRFRGKSLSIVRNLVAPTVWKLRIREHGQRIKQSCRVSASAQRMNEVLH